MSAVVHPREGISAFRAKKNKAEKKKALLRLPRWSPTLVLTELDDA